MQADRAEAIDRFGCSRAVLLKDNAELSGRMLWFSWPSDGTLVAGSSDQPEG